MRERLLGELQPLALSEDLLAWAKVNLPTKNTLQAADATAVETAYRSRLEASASPEANASNQDSSAADQLRPLEPIARADVDSEVVEVETRHPAPTLAFPKEPPRKRSKAHLLFVREQPCLICKQSPSDPHHLRFAQPRALGRKVSDEFTSTASWTDMVTRGLGGPTCRYPRFLSRGSYGI
ncbi:DUF968 domain-containing protein [Bradyrhizobium sp. USDA 3650]